MAEGAFQCCPVFRNFHHSSSVQFHEDTTMGMSAGNQKAQINVTPTIDVLLVLIIIFMVITPLTPTGLKTLVPQPAPADEKPQPVSNDIVISVRNDKTLRL